MPRDDRDSSVDSVTGKLANNRAEVQLKVLKPFVQKDNYGCLESMSAQTAQPDLISQHLLM